jgi:fatty-acyl-CoA synthase
MKSTMQEAPLLVSAILRYGAYAYGDSNVYTYHGDTTTKRSFAEIYTRSSQLAHGLASIGVSTDDRVATFSFNHNQHLEAYYAVPSMGAVLHTLNIRLFADQLSFVINDAADSVVVADVEVLPLLARVLRETPTVKHVVVVGSGDTSVLDGFNVTVHDYESLIADKPKEYPWVDIDERSAAAMCYTSGTTGNPKGVVYSHRSTYLHSLSAISGNSLGLNKDDRALVIVPMFHANAWGIPYAAFMAGADMIMPTRFLQAKPLADIIEKLRPTIASGVPTIWNDLYHYLENNPIDISCFRLISSGGAAAPEALIRGYKERFGVHLVQGWGMTETSPLVTLAMPPRGVDEEGWMKYQLSAGKPVIGTEIRVVDDSGKELPNDGKSIGELEVRGPWITGSYYNRDAPDSFDNGWLRTGDMATIDPERYMRIVDRTKDVIKSGGEWVSSVELENTIMAHEAVLEAAVIGVPDEKWDERPLACVVIKPGLNVTPEELSEFLKSRVAKWWIPERWCFVSEIPKTSVGKFDKKVLRKDVGDGRVEVLKAGS